MPSLVRKKPKSGWDGKRVARSIFQRDIGTFQVKVAVNGKTHRATFATLEEAVQWRDEMQRKRLPRMGNRFLPGTGVSTLHRSTWEPADYELDREAIRRQLSSGNRSTVERDGREFTLVELPYIPPVTRARWDDMSPLKALARISMEAA